MAGLQVPAIPFDEVLGNAGTVPPSQMVNVVPKLNVGVIFGFTVTVKVAVVAHCPASGVNVYVIVPITDVFITAGFHVPVTPLFEAVGNAGAVAFWQSGPICVNTGVSCALTVTLKVVTAAHCPVAGVNV